MTTTRTAEDIYVYQQQAIDLLSKDHPHYNEIRLLLTDQVLDDLNDCTAINRGATTT